MSDLPSSHSVAEDLLSHLRVVDLSTEVARDCARFLGSLGATITRVEREALESDPEVFRAFVREADIVVESFMPGDMAALDLGYDALSANNPGLIQVSITPFGQSGPYAHYKGRELVASALAGTLFQMGERDGPPVREPGDANFFHACAAGAAGALVAEQARKHTGRGQLVDISAQEMGAGRATVALVKHMLGDKVPGRNGQSIDMGNGPSRVLWPLKDGLAFYMEGKPGTPAAADMDNWILEETGTAPDPSHDMETVAAFLASMTEEEAIAGARARRIRLMSVSGPRDVANDTHLAARGYFSDGGQGKQPAYFIKAIARDQA